jgi:hypothetical protein
MSPSQSQRTRENILSFLPGTLPNRRHSFSTKKREKRGLAICPTQCQHIPPASRYEPQLPRLIGEALADKIRLEGI